MMARINASDLAHRLGRQAEAVCRRYLSNGRRQGGYWQVGDVRNAIHLSETFRRNAMSQLDCAAWAAKRSAGSLALHSIAIAIELLLKYHLLRTASPDAWNRVQIGHDLDRAARYAARAGLELPSRLAVVIDQLHPYFQRGGFHRDAMRTWPPGFADDAGGIVRELAQKVFEHGHQDAHGS